MTPLRQARVRAGLSIAALSRLIGKPYHLMRQYDTGRFTIPSDIEEDIFSALNQLRVIRTQHISDHLNHYKRRQIWRRAGRPAKGGKLLKGAQHAS